MAFRTAEHENVAHLYKRQHRDNSNAKLGEVELFDRRRRNKGPLPPGCTGIQYKKAKKNGDWSLTLKESDNCIYLKDLTIVQISNFVKLFDGRNVIVGRKFNSRTDIYKTPLPSSSLLEFSVSKLVPYYEAWDVKHIKCKAVRIPSKITDDLCADNNSFFVFPLFMQ